MLFYTGIFLHRIWVEWVWPKETEEDTNKDNKKNLKIYVEDLNAALENEASRMENNKVETSNVSIPSQTCEDLLNW